MALLVFFGFIAGADVDNGAVNVASKRLYDLVELPRVERRLLRFAPGKG